MFHSTPGSTYEDFRPPTAEWIIEASEKMVESFLKHIVKWIKPPRVHNKDSGKSISRFSSMRFPMTHLSVVFDEISYRVNKLLSGKSINAFLQRK